MSPERKKGTPKKALKLINERLDKALVKTGPRLHDNGRENLYHTGRAIRDLCGNCTHAEINTRTDKYVRHAPFVSIRCQKGLRPINISRDTPLGSELSCSKFQQK